MQKRRFNSAPGSAGRTGVERANDPIGLYVNDKLIALGEVVVVEENFGIKVTQLVGESE